MSDVRVRDEPEFYALLMSRELLGDQLSIRGQREQNSDTGFWTGH